MLKISSDQRRGFSLTELLVALAIVAVLMSLIFPALGYSRASAARITCLNNAKQISLACQNYESVHQWIVPHGTQAYVGLLPYLGLGEFGNIHSASSPATLFCPVDAELQSSEGDISYFFNDGSGRTSDYRPGPEDGVFLGSSRQFAGVALSEISDGASQTALASERLAATRREPTAGRPPATGSRIPYEAWRRWSVRVTTRRDPSSERLTFADDCLNLRGLQTSAFVPAFPSSFGLFTTGTYNHLNLPNTPTCVNGAIDPDRYFDVLVSYPAASEHRGGVNVAFCDGHTSFISSAVDVDVWRSAGTRAGREQSGGAEF